jgi:hypothetical protein
MECSRRRNKELSDTRSSLRALRVCRCDHVALSGAVSLVPVLNCLKICCRSTRPCTNTNIRHTSSATFIESFKSSIGAKTSCAHGCDVWRGAFSLHIKEVPTIRGTGWEDGGEGHDGAVCCLWVLSKSER